MARSEGDSSIETRSFSRRSAASSRPRPERTWLSPLESLTCRRARGSWVRNPRRPCTVTEPAAGGASPPSAFSRVVLPAPFLPTRPTLSPARTMNDASSKVTRPPTSTCRCLASSTPSMMAEGDPRPEPDYFARGAGLYAVVPAVRFLLGEAGDLPDGDAQQPGNP